MGPDRARAEALKSSKQKKRRPGRGSEELQAQLDVTISPILNRQSAVKQMLCAILCDVVRSCGSHPCDSTRTFLCFKCLRRHGVATSAGIDKVNMFVGSLDVTGQKGAGVGVMSVENLPRLIEIFQRLEQALLLRPRHIDDHAQGAVEF